jgi:hypothetical protein
MRVASLSFFIMISLFQLSHAVDLTGDWVGTVTFAQRPLPMRLHFETKGENLTGAITIPTERILNSSLTNIKSDLNKFHFELETPSGPMNFDGTPTKNSIHGTLKQKELQGNFEVIHLFSVDPKKYFGIYEFNPKEPYLHPNMG